MSRAIPRGSRPVAVAKSHGTSYPSAGFLHDYEPHIGSLSRLADRFGINSIVLLRMLVCQRAPTASSTGGESASRSRYLFCHLRVPPGWIDVNDHRSALPWLFRADNFAGRTACLGPDCLRKPIDLLRRQRSPVSPPTRGSGEPGGRRVEESGKRAATWRDLFSSHRCLRRSMPPGAILVYRHGASIAQLARPCSGSPSRFMARISAL